MRVNGEAAALRAGQRLERADDGLEPREEDAEFLDVLVADRQMLAQQLGGRADAARCRGRVEIGIVIVDQAAAS